jgi:hypothetical protein
MNDNVGLNNRRETRARQTTAFAPFRKRPFSFQEVSQHIKLRRMMCYSRNAAFVVSSQGIQLRDPFIFMAPRAICPPALPSIYNPNAWKAAAGILRIPDTLPTDASIDEHVNVVGEQLLTGQEVPHLTSPTKASYNSALNTRCRFS